MVVPGACQAIPVTGLRHVKRTLTVPRQCSGTKEMGMTWRLWAITVKAKVWRYQKATTLLEKELSEAGQGDLGQEERPRMRNLSWADRYHVSLLLLGGHRVVVHGQQARFVLKNWARLLLLLPTRGRVDMSSASKATCRYTQCESYGHIVAKSFLAHSLGTQKYKLHIHY